MSNHVRMAWNNAELNWCKAEQREREREQTGTLLMGWMLHQKHLGGTCGYVAKHLFTIQIHYELYIRTSISEVYSSLKNVSHAPLGALREHYFFDGIQLITDACVGGTLLYPEGTSRAHFVGVSPLDKLQSLGALTANFCTPRLHIDLLRNQKLLAKMNKQ